MTLEILFEPGLKPIIKHGTHDQKTHGNWANDNYDEESQGEMAQNIYFERYGFDRDGKPTGTTVKEIDSLVHYTGEGYAYINNGLRGNRSLGDAEQEIVKELDKLIEESPSLFGDKNLYRVYSERVISELEEGDIVTDKGYLSTTRIDLTQDDYARQTLGNIKESRDRVAIILPSEGKTGKGLAVDKFVNAVSGVKGTGSFSTAQADLEKEVLLPRGTALKFLGMKRDVNNEAEIAVFQRLDK